MNCSKTEYISPSLLFFPFFLSFWCCIKYFIEKSIKKEKKEKTEMYCLIIKYLNNKYYIITNLNLCTKIPKDSHYICCVLIPVQHTLCSSKAQWIKYQNIIWQLTKLSFKKQNKDTKHRDWGNCTQFLPWRRKLTKTITILTFRTFQCFSTSDVCPLTKHSFADWCDLNNSKKTHDYAMWIKLKTHW